MARKGFGFSPERIKQIEEALSRVPSRADADEDPIAQSKASDFGPTFNQPALHQETVSEEISNANEVQKTPDQLRLSELEGTLPKAWFEAIRKVSLTEMTPLEKNGLIAILAEYSQLTRPEALEEMSKEILLVKSEIIDRVGIERLEQMQREIDILRDRISNLTAAELKEQSNQFIAAVRTGRVTELPDGNAFAQLPKIKYDLIEEQLKVSANQELSDAPVEIISKNEALVRQSIVFTASLGLAAGSFGATSVIGKMLMEKWSLNSTLAKRGIETVGSGVQTVNNSLVDLIFSIPGAPEILEKIYLNQDGLASKGTTLGTGAYTIGAALSATTLYYILRDKGLGWTKTGRIMLLCSALGGGYAVFKTAVDTDQLGQDAKAGVARIEPVKTRAEAAKKRVTQIDETITGTVDSEVRKEAATGYGPVTSFISELMTGSFDKEKFDAAAKAQKKTDEWTKKQEANSAALIQLKAKFGLSESQGLSALPGILLNKSLNTKQLEAAVNLLKSVAEKAQDANIYDNLLSNLNPLDGGSSRLGLYNEEVGLVRELGNIPKQYVKLRPEIIERLKAFADEAIKIEPKAKAAIERILSEIISKLPQDLGFDSQTIEAMIQGIPVPDDTLPVPWGEDLKKLQASLVRTGIDVDFSRAWNFSSDLTETFNNNRDIVIVLLLFLVGFMQLDTGSTNLDRLLGGSRARRRHYEDKMPKQFEAIQQREYVLSSLVAGFIEAQYARVVSHVGVNSLAALKPPSDLMAMYIRRQLREQFENDVNSPSTVSAIFSKKANEAPKSDQESRTPDSSTGRFIHGFVLGVTPADVDRMNTYGEWLDAITEDFKRDPAMASAMLSRAFDPSHDELFRINKELDETFDQDARNTLVRTLENQALQGRVEMLKNSAIAISERISALEGRFNALNEVGQDEENANPLPLSMTLDTSQPNFALPEQDVVKMVAIARAQTELSAAKSTLAQIQKMGIRLKDIPEFKPGYLKSDRFDFSYTNALTDQEIREREQARVLGREGVTATAEDMDRFHTIMQGVMSVLESKKEVIKQNEYIKDFIPVYKYDLAEQLIRVELRRDSSVGDIYASLTFPSTVPNFNSADPEVVIKEIDTWLSPDSDEIRGLVAQTEHKELHLDLEAARKKVHSVTGNSMQVELFNLNSKISLGNEVMSRVSEYVNLDRLYNNQAKYKHKIDKGLPIDDKTFRLFVDPYQTQSLLTSEPNIQEVSQIMDQLYDVPQEISILFDIDTKSVRLVAPDSSKVLPWKRSQKGSLSRSIPLNEFSLDKIRSVIEQYKQAKEA